MAARTQEAYRPDPDRQRAWHCELIRAAQLTARQYADIEPVLIGGDESLSAEEWLELHPASDLNECHQVMEALDEGRIDGCVTLHYSFPLGVSTVGKVVTLRWVAR